MQWTRLLLGSAVLTLLWAPRIRCMSYAVLSVDSESTNEQLIKISVGLEFIMRGCYGVSGYFYLHQDLFDDHSIIRIDVSYNAAHNNHFSLSPLKILPSKILDIMNNFYKTYLMKSLANCSDFPQLETGWKSYEGLGKNYTMNRCLIDPAGFSELRSGFYSISAILSRKVDPVVTANTTFVIEVENTF